MLTLFVVQVALGQVNTVQVSFNLILLVYFTKKCYLHCVFHPNLSIKSVVFTHTYSRDPVPYEALRTVHLVSSQSSLKCTLCPPLRLVTQARPCS